MKDKAPKPSGSGTKKVGLIKTPAGSLAKAGGCGKKGQ